MLEATVYNHELVFDTPRGTSRGIISKKPAPIIEIRDKETGKLGIGECSIIPGLSYDDKPNFNLVLKQCAQALEHGASLPDLNEWPGINFGIDTALRHLKSGSAAEIFQNGFSQNGTGIEINGLIWMGKPKEMLMQIEEKLAAGFSCIKLKIGAVDFNEEVGLIKNIRNSFSAKEITVRVDANGAFSLDQAKEKLDKLAGLEVQSIEQPIKAGQWQEMAQLCSISPLPIALDEELIGITSAQQRQSLMNTIKPQALVLKPGLLGGFEICDDWIALCDSHNAFWWATSALESNIGLNAIAQYTATKKVKIPQGLGTGMLYVNNIESPLEIKRDKLFYNGQKNWKYPWQ